MRVQGGTRGPTSSCALGPAVGYQILLLQCMPSRVITGIKQVVVGKWENEAEGEAEAEGDKVLSPPFPYA